VEVIADWRAKEQSLAPLKLPVLLLAGEHDYVTLHAMKGWQELADLRSVVFPRAHHGEQVAREGDAAPQQ
jgi:pimeloyl-ACP methyl ester carboxylesterase